MAIMRTNRLTSNTTKPSRKFTPASELEAQDAAYTKYKQGSEAYTEKMKRYETLTKNSTGRDYRPFFGSESSTRRLNAEETKQFNIKERSESDYLYEPGDLYLEQKNINVPKSASKNPLAGLKNVNSYMSDYIKPTAPKKTKPADWSNVELGKIETKKAKITTEKGSLKKLKATPELPDFEGPTKSAGVKNRVDMNPLAQGAYTQGAKGRYAKQVVESIGKTGKTRGFDRERKQFEGYAAVGGGQTKETFRYEMKASKAVGARYRAEGNAEGAEMMRQEAKQYRKAAQFAGKLEKNKNKYFDRGMVSSFRDSKQHAANRNTIEAKITAAGKSANRNNMY